MSKLVCLLFIVFWSNSSFALSYKEVDSLTYFHYQNANYKLVQTIGKEALKENIDFYYLRVRLGLSYYFESNFENAWPHLLKAVDMNPSDKEILKYTYQSLVLTSQNEVANEFLVKYPQTNNEIKPLSKGLNKIEFESGNIFSNNEKEFYGKPLSEIGNYYEGNFFSNMKIIRVYLEGKISPDLSYSLGVNLFETTHLSKFKFSTQDIETYHQNDNYQFNAGVSKLFKSNGKLGYSVAYYRQNFSYPYTISRASSVPPLPVMIRDSIEKTSELSMSLFYSKRMKFIEPIIFLNYGTFDLSDNLQAELGLTYFPLGHDRLYAYSSVSYLNNSINTGFAFNQKIGFGLNQKFALEANFLGGKLGNYMGSAGFITLNTFDPINYSTGLNLSINTPKVSIVPSYRFQMREMEYFTENSPGNFVSHTHNYYSHLFYITLRWKL
ncbi:MAG: hypothetical protein K9H61_13060 [Bacteroidia bacterium]|nr:hypothetical protein [Bacteroidia bacterium]MCF8425405.1 hypothetical protein [Bacteroidia bacterium]MCF8447912.1 hypothetical protein [Bacteroidia bacterium]